MNTESPKRGDIWLLVRQVGQLSSDVMLEIVTAIATVVEYEDQS